MAYSILLTLACLCLLTSLLPMIRQPHGIFRIFDFPRPQIAILSLIVAALALALLPVDNRLLVLLGMLMIALVIQLVHIVRFSPVWPRCVRSFKGAPGSAPTLRILVSNVKQSNTNHARLIDLVKRAQPDIALFMETDQAWTTALQALADEMDRCLEHPLDNTYGMALYSRLPTVDARIQFLTNPEVPSFDCHFTLQDGSTFRLLTVHPEPPVVHDDTIGRDAEIAKVAQLVRHDENPVIVTGDLNDVAWSPGTRRFVRISGMLDPREGRGQYNSFDARFFFLRWPLDHIFLSPHFQIISMRRQPFIGSDHFPMLYDLALVPDGRPHREPDPFEAADVDEAKELITTEISRDRRPAGHDWENSQD